MNVDATHCDSRGNGQGRQRALYGSGTGALDGIAKRCGAEPRAEARQARGPDGLTGRTLRGARKVREEIAELESAGRGRKSGNLRENRAICSSARPGCPAARHRHRGCPAGANAKFERRFRHVETALQARGLQPSDVELDELEALWTAAKRSLG